MSNLKKDHQYFVSAENFGIIILRREPNLNLMTEDEKDNVILSMFSGSLVTLKSTKIHTADGFEWYNILYEDKDQGIKETGWAALAAVTETPLVGAPFSQDFSFSFEQTTYSISESNLAVAQTNKLIFAKQELNTEPVTINSTPFFTTAKNIGILKAIKLIFS